MAVKISHLDIDDYWMPQATWTVGGTPTDPTTIIVTGKDADGTITHITTASSPSTLTTASTPLARSGTGVFYLNPGTQMTKAGYWFTHFKGTGAAAAAEEHQAIVDPSEFNASGGLSSRALVGLAETKDWLQSQNIDTAEDLEVVAAINGASELAHDESGREFKRVDTTSSPTIRLFGVDNLTRNGFVQIGDLSTTPTLVRILASDWSSSIATITDYQVYPNSRESWAPVTALEFESTVIRPQSGQLIEVTGVWGFPSVPPQIKDAVKDVVAERLDRDVEHYTRDFAPVTAGQGQNVIVLGARPSFLSANPRSLAIFRSFRKPQVG